MIDEGKLDTIKQQFKEFSRDYAETDESDPDVLRGIAEDITTVGNKLEVDVSEWADPLFEQADDIESERRSDEPEPEYEDRGWLDDSKALRDVDEMFQGLLREITERAS